jgi:hypothetical protein
MWEWTLDERPSIFIRDKHIHSSERMLHKGYDRKDYKKNSGRNSKGTWRQEERIDGKPTVVK